MQIYFKMLLILCYIYHVISCLDVLFIPVPIPMLVLGPNSDNEKIFYDDLDGCELCDNVTYLG